MCAVIGCLLRRRRVGGAQQTTTLLLLLAVEVFWPGRIFVDNCEFYVLFFVILYFIECHLS